MQKVSLKLWQLLALIALTICGLLQSAEAAGKMGLLEKFWKPICDLSEELDTRPGDAITQLDGAVSAIEAMLLVQLRAATFAQINFGTDKGRAGQLVAAHFATKAHTAIEKLKSTTIEEQTAAAATTAYLKGRLDEWLEIMHNTKSSSPHACLANSEETTRQQTPEAPSEATNAQGNFPPSRRDGYKSAPYNSRIPNAKKAGDDGDTWQDDNLKCRLLAADTTDGITHTTAATGNFKVASGYIEIKTNGGVITVTDLSRLTETTGQQHQAFIDAWKATKSNKGTGESEYANSTGDITTLTGIAAAVNQGHLNKEETDEAGVEKLVKQYFGDKIQDKWTGLLTEIEKQPIPDKIAGRQKNGKLGDVTDVAQLTAILSHYTELNMATYAQIKQKAEEKAALSKETAEIRTTEKTCNDLKEKEDCDTNKKCTYDKTKAEGKKCTLSDEAKKTGQKEAEKAAENQEGKDGKTTTNTTGSNSFVINKAPLWLAFLLF
uniref:Variable surface glycoprotein n=1 Tax=Trypanosoma evansi TaxID=5697 RepID=Q968L3_TRYEV|nr:variable surface glycoprotein [Trypanosoma evansi]